MRQTKLGSNQSRFWRLDRFTIAMGLLLLAATVTSAEAPTQVDTSLITDSEVPISESVLEELLEIQQQLVTVSDAPTETDTSQITDSENPIPNSVAHELLEIQQRLGGSIVSDRQSLQDIPSHPSAVQAEATDFPAVVVQFSSDDLEGQAAQKSINPFKTVESLRDAAWQLDQSAEKLERAELYQQADAVRDLAQQFRLDARVIRTPAGG